MFCNFFLFWELHLSFDSDDVFLHLSHQRERLNSFDLKAKKVYFCGQDIYNYDVIIVKPAILKPKKDILDDEGRKDD